jgi:hypothetical protein
MYYAYRVSFPEVKLPERGADHPPPSSADINERLELYFYSPFEPSWPVIERALNLEQCMRLGIALTVIFTRGGPRTLLASSPRPEVLFYLYYS